MEVELEGPPAVGLMHLLPMQHFPKLPSSIYDLKYKAIVIEVTKEVCYSCRVST